MGGQRGGERRGDGAGREARDQGVLARIGHLIVDQALPLAVASVSFVIALDAWMAARPVVWEQQRALASVAVRSEALASGVDASEAVTTVTISNVGALTFVILDLRLDMHASSGLHADWTRNTLVSGPESALPIGLRPFRLEPSDSPSDARFRFDDSKRTWHVVDPGRSIEVMLVQPVSGRGRIATTVSVYTQPIRMGDVEEQIVAFDQVAGVARLVMPESGEGEVSELPIFPYSSGNILVVGGADRR